MNPPASKRPRDLEPSAAPLHRRTVVENSREGVDDPVPLRRRRPRKSTDALRTESLSAAATVFAQRGYGGASTKEIADLAGTTQASIYRHYGSKAELFVAAVADPFIEPLFLPDGWYKPTRTEVVNRRPDGPLAGPVWIAGQSRG